MMETNHRVRKIKWLCRRGMKELDIMLERFVDRNISELSHGAWPELESLLQHEDDQLWDWLRDPEQHEVHPYRVVLEQIRDS
jgi:antitoxin CptB